MGDQSSTENCELIALFALHKVLYLPVSVALYRANGCKLPRVNAQRREKVKWEIGRIILKLGLDAKIVDDNTLSLLSA